MIRLAFLGIIGLFIISPKICYMRHKSLVFTGLIALCSSFLAPQTALSQPAPGQKGFFCDTSTGTPTTLYQNSQGSREPWIK